MNEDMTKRYASAYINNALQNDKVFAPDHNLSGKYSEILTPIYKANLQGGMEAVHQEWEKQCKLYPRLTQLIDVLSKRKLRSIQSVKDSPPLEWIILGIIPKQGTCEIHGAAGSGKSLFLIDLGLNIAENWRVVYLAAEGVSGYPARVRSWEGINNKIASANLNFYPSPINLLDHREIEDFILDMRPFNPDLIIIDTLARCMIGGDENSSKDMGLAIAACDRIRDDLETSILIAHHTGKTGSSERGSSSLRGACDSMMELTNHDGMITVSSSKLKDGEPFETKRFTIAKHGDSVALVPVVNKKKPETKSSVPALKPNYLKILEMLNMAIYADNGATYKRISENTSLQGSTLDRILSRLKADGYIAQSTKGEPYTITPKGKKALPS